jgi:dihydroorotate dehydrogenase electron transfer subunit
MLRAVAELSRRFHVACQVSLEARMACGTGICLGCVVKLQGPKRGQPRVGEGRYERVCTEGPIFDAQEVCWDESQHY